MIADEERAARAVLSLAGNPGDRRLFDAVRTAGGTHVLAALRDGAGSVDGLGRPERYAARLRGDDAARILAATTQAGARVVVAGDKEWPRALEVLTGLDTPLSAPPLALWLRGPLRLCDVDDQVTVAVVGSRASTSYGNEVATTLGYELASAGAIVVSGAASGIDGAAHRGALAADGRTIAVLAGGIDRVYPSGHESLVRRIGETGLVVSEAPPGAHPSRSRFLTRNRLIAALSRGAVVVEAAMRSGALNTVHWAGQLSRQVMAIPGPVSSELSAGPHRAVIDRAAELVTDAADVLELVSPAGRNLQGVRRGEERPIDRLPPDVLAVLEALPSRDARSAGELAVVAGVAVDLAVAALGRLAVEGWVERTEDGWRRRVGP